jgi:23S rRNA A2030 N6-methylase RlmJ
MEFTGRQRRRGGLIQKKHTIEIPFEVKDTYNTNLRLKKYYIKKKIVNFSVLPYPIQSEDEVKLIIDGLRNITASFVMPIK